MNIGPLVNHILTVFTYTDSHEAVPLTAGCVPLGKSRHKRLAWAGATTEAVQYMPYNCEDLGLMSRISPQNPQGKDWVWLKTYPQRFNERGRQRQGHPWKLPNQPSSVSWLSSRPKAPRKWYYQWWPLHTQKLTYACAQPHTCTSPLP